MSIFFQKPKLKLLQKDKPIKEMDLKVCYICGKTFKQSGALKLHIRFHTKTKPFGNKYLKNTNHIHIYFKIKSNSYNIISDCKICGKQFYTKTTQKDHMNSHNDEKKFSCPTCGKLFATNRQLRKHLVIHRSRKLQCTMCPKKFIYPYEVQAHMMVHTGYKPFQCVVCNLKFRFSWNLKKHMEQNHKDVAITDAAILKLEPTNVIDMKDSDVENENENELIEVPLLLEQNCDSTELLTIEAITSSECINDDSEIYYEYIYETDKLK